MALLYVAKTFGIAGVLAGLMCLLISFRSYAASNKYALRIAGLALFGFGVSIIAVAMIFAG